MQVDVISDFHVEFNGNFYQKLLNDSPSKKIIIAGDMGPISMPEVQAAFTWLANRYEEVIYVPGNHDYYGTSINSGNNLLETLEDYLLNLTILKPGRMTTIGDYKVIGSTLWVPYTFDLVKYPINDLLQIVGILHDLEEMNQKAKNFFEVALDEKTILVTHHLPHYKCISDQYKGDPTNCWFFSDESKLIDDRNPYMVIFGHSHTRMNFDFNKTRFINNAYGYQGEHKKFKLLRLDI